MVNDLDNGSESALARVAVSDNDDAADLDEAPVGSLNKCFAHCDGDLVKEYSSQPEALVGK